MCRNIATAARHLYKETQDHEKTSHYIETMKLRHIANRTWPVFPDGSSLLILDKAPWFLDATRFTQLLPHHRIIGPTVYEWSRSTLKGVA